MLKVRIKPSHGQTLHEVLASFDNFLDFFLVLLVKFLRQKLGNITES
jgi:hypothetical protein